MIEPKIKEAWAKLKADCSRVLYGECSTLACMAKDGNGRWIKPYIFVGCRELIITDAYVQAEARARMAEFQLENGPFGNPRHYWTLDDYVKEVEEELRG